MINKSSEEAVESIDDLLIEILLKLPLRSLARFKLVSRRWHSIIVKHCLVLRNPNPAVGLFLPTGFDTYKYLCFDLKTQRDYCPPCSFVEKLPFHDDPAWPIWIHQSCNGLLLCCSSCETDDLGNWHFDDPVRRCYVYNPTTQDLARIRACDDGSIVTVSLAFDPCKSPFYKAVCVRRSGAEVEVEVYSAESNAWRSSGKPAFDLRAWCVNVSMDVPGKFWHAVYWNSSIHWVDWSDHEILYFNIDDERFRKISLPAAMHHHDDGGGITPPYFGESCGHLHITSVGQRFLKVFEMKEDYSGWLVKYRVSIRTLREVTSSSTFWSVLSVTRGQQGSFLFALKTDRVVRYDLARRTFRTILRFKKDDIYRFAPISYSGLHGFQYIESVARV